MCAIVKAMTWVQLHDLIAYTIGCGMADMSDTMPCNMTCMHILHIACFVIALGNT